MDCFLRLRRQYAIFDVAADWQPAGSVSGDFYDVIDIA